MHTDEGAPLRKSTFIKNVEHSQSGLFTCSHILGPHLCRVVIMVFTDVKGSLGHFFLITSMVWSSWKNSAYQCKHYYKRESRIYFWTRSMWQQCFLLSIVFWSDTSQSINSCSSTDQSSLYFHKVLNSLKIYFNGKKYCWWFCGFFLSITELMMLSENFG